MKTSMLEYCKMVLRKVSFSKKLFLKEYRKSRQWLAPHERSDLKAWIKNDKCQTIEKSGPIQQNVGLYENELFISPAIVQWQNIDAFQEVAKSPNAKIVVTDGDTPMLINQSNEK